MLLSEIQKKNFFDLIASEIIYLIFEGNNISKKNLRDEYKCFTCYYGHIFNFDLFILT